MLGQSIFAKGPRLYPVIGIAAIAMRQVMSNAADVPVVLRRVHFLAALL